MRFPDLSLAFRNIFRRPGFAVVAIALLALGSGANAAVFSVVRGVLIRPLPFPDPDRIVAVWPNQFISNEDLVVLAGADAQLQRDRGAVAGMDDGTGRRRRRADQGHRRARVRQPVQDARRRRGARPDDRAGQRDSRTASRRRAVRLAVAQPLQRRSVDHRPRHSARSGTAHHHRRDAARVRSLRPRHRSVGAAALDARQRAIQGDVLAGPGAARAWRHARCGDARADRSRDRRCERIWDVRTRGARRCACRRSRTRSPATCVRLC